ncbi:MAG: hypothetical protein WA081_02890 [Desulfosalsimonadaceae bacterium]
MSNQSIGKFAALLIFECLLFISAITVTPGLSHAQLSELSEIQSGIFYLSHNNIGINAETFSNDQYIDDDQANFLASISRTAPYTPADDNYPFYLVDHYVLDSDLEIIYDYKSTTDVAYPQRAYLSRHNISYADYTNRKSPPELFFNVIKGIDPYTGKKATAVYWKVTDYETTVAEMRHKSVTPGENCYIGYVYNTYVRIDSAQVAVWTRTSDTDLMKRCASPSPKENSCLPPSAVRQPRTIRILRIPFDPSCPSNELPWLVPPRSRCYYPFPPERNSAATVNWSYNYRNGNLTPALVQSRESQGVQPIAIINPCRDCR